MTRLRRTRMAIKTPIKQSRVAKISTTPAKDDSNYANEEMQATIWEERSRISQQLQVSHAIWPGPSASTSVQGPMPQGDHFR
ncbi:LOW QUALITY PROTEIN: hypothetical protein ACO22_06652 [Paracoccidioides brasiliensis]|uniref:Uncharacterized protein n=1 Tax=Paracoccidioides brasiliensis TaxID=121759 RepID=A0A1D2J753_PARBR|nr:LOW QUALITY PROTEIN: hypothetical protein ACO22_06652 [Paracoccidioides brasiliensis]